MKILVCTKQVPDGEALLKVDDSGKGVITEHTPRYQMNSFDEYAVEEAVALKESHPGTTVDVLSLGPPRVRAVLERALGMGADGSLHLETESESGLSPLTVATWIAAGIRPRRYDLIFTGAMSEDGLSGQVGPLLAELLGYPCATSVIRLQLDPENSLAVVEREIEGGLREQLEMKLPVVLAVQTGLNKPRYPTLSGLLRAKKQAPLVIRTADLEQIPNPDNLLGLGRPVRTRAGEILTGDTREKAARLVSILREKALLKGDADR
jgi:electron transfer flavoprotein beta subunit